MNKISVSNVRSTGTISDKFDISNSDFYYATRKFSYILNFKTLKIHVCFNCFYGEKILFKATFIKCLIYTISIMKTLKNIKQNNMKSWTVTYNKLILYSLSERLKRKKYSSALTIALRVACELLQAYWFLCQLKQEEDMEYAKRFLNYFFKDQKKNIILLREIQNSFNRKY